MVLVWWTLLRCLLPLSAVENRNLVEKQIYKELDLGRYIVCDEPPLLVSALGAIPKSDTAVRIIHDLSRPKGGLNKFAENTSVRYPTLLDATKMMSKGSFLAKLDLKEAYRSIPVHKNCFNYTGLQWLFEGSDQPTFMFDSRLPFGASLSCRIFQSLTDAIVRMLKKRGIQSIGYIDDFLLICDDFVSCERALKVAVELIQSLGLSINWDKVGGPARSITFLGVLVNCENRTLSLPDKKLAEVKQLVAQWVTKKKATKRELQCIVGRLNWCSRVVRGGRTFLRNLINLICKVKQPHHYVRIGAAAHADLLWWGTGLSLFHGSSPFLNDLPVPGAVFSTDACLEGGAGHFAGDWFYVDWVRDFGTDFDSNINVLELKCVLIAVKRWGHLWSGQHIMVRSDNSSTVACVNNNTSRSLGMLSIVKELFWYSVKFNFLLSASFIPGKLNIMSDRISRLNDVESARQAYQLLKNCDGDVILCKGHMSHCAFMYLQSVWCQS
jgi:hypothetical protein